MALSLEHLSIALNGRTLIAPFSLVIQPGEIVTLMGPSGSGKSSLLSLIAGELELPFDATGEVDLDSKPLGGLAPEARNIGRLFQDDLLFPHLTAGQNLLFGMPRGPKREREAAMQAALQDAGLSGFAERAPHTLSGGERSRVALMRALLARPAAMLLDEPFNKLDASLRASLRGFVFAHLAARAIPCLLVTHDRADAPPGSRILTIGESGEIRDA